MARCPHIVVVHILPRTLARVPCSMFHDSKKRAQRTIGTILQRSTAVATFFTSMRRGWILSTKPHTKTTSPSTHQLHFVHRPCWFSLPTKQGERNPQSKIKMSEVVELQPLAPNADSSEDQSEEQLVRDNEYAATGRALKVIFSSGYWERLQKRALYEIALLFASLPHLVPKCFLLKWGAMVLFRNLAYMRHDQRPRLKDLGFELIAENTDDAMSEFFLFVNTYLTLLLVFMPVLTSHANNYGMFSVTIFNKIINLLCVGHVLRFFTFISTSLPGPALHCQEGAPLYRHDGFTLYEILTRRSRVHVDPNW